MSAEAAALVRTFKVGRYRVTFTCPHPRRGEVRHTVIEWEPTFPSRRLNRIEARDYRAARMAVFAELGAGIEYPLIVADLEAPL